jgi:hypothetical protein
MAWGAPCVIVFDFVFSFLAFHSSKAVFAFCSLFFVLWRVQESICRGLEPDGRAKKGMRQGVFRGVFRGIFRYGH